MATVECFETPSVEEVEQAIVSITLSAPKITPFIARALAKEVDVLLRARLAAQAGDMTMNIMWSRVGNRLMDIGDRLARDLVCGVRGLNHLLQKWEDHGYRPTLRPDGEPGVSILADIYDSVAAARFMKRQDGSVLTCYRGL